MGVDIVQEKIRAGEIVASERCEIATGTADGGYAVVLGEGKCTVEYGGKSVLVVDKGTKLDSVRFGWVDGKGKSLPPSAGSGSTAVCRSAVSGSVIEPGTAVVGSEVKDSEIKWGSVVNGSMVQNSEINGIICRSDVSDSVISPYAVLVEATVYNALVPSRLCVRQGLRIDGGEDESSGIVWGTGHLTVNEGKDRRAGATLSWAVFTDSDGEVRLSLSYRGDEAIFQDSTVLDCDGLDEFLEEYLDKIEGNYRVGKTVAEAMAGALPAIKRAVKLATSHLDVFEMVAV